MRVVVKLDNRFPQITGAMRDAIDRIVRETAKAIEGNIKVGMASAHSGAVYGAHQASAAGEMPAIDTGALINSIQSDTDGPMQAAVHTNVDHAVYLEYGTIHMAPRPFMVPAAEAERSEFVRRLSNLEDEL